jgi:hypothetical protein
MPDNLGIPTWYVHLLIRRLTMFRATCILFCSFSILILGPVSASADSGLTYTISGDYSPTTSPSQLSGPSDIFTMSFTLAVQPTTTDFLLGDDFFVDAPVQFSYSASNGGTASGLVYLAFYSLSAASQTGGLFVDFCADGPSCATGLEYQWIVPGPLLYSGPESEPTLLLTSFQFSDGQFLQYHCTFCNDLDATGTFAGSVNAMSTPEPKSSALLITGLICLLGICVSRRKQSNLTSP